MINTESAGGTRFSQGKPQMTWSPWLGMWEVSRVSEYGAQKYAPLDWQEGQSFTTLLNSAMRHLSRSMSAPQSRDHESGHLHIGHAAWNLLTILHFMEEGRLDLDNVTPWQGVSTEERMATEAALSRKEVP